VVLVLHEATLDEVVWTSIGLSASARSTSALHRPLIETAAAEENVSRAIVMDDLLDYLSSVSLSSRGCRHRCGSLRSHSHTVHGLDWYSVLLLVVLLLLDLTCVRWRAYIEHLVVSALRVAVAVALLHDLHVVLAHSICGSAHPVVYARSKAFRVSKSLFKE
jgi:hypothetical protein